MAKRIHANNAVTLLDGTITAIATSLTVIDSSKFPAIGAGETFRLTLQASTGEIEIVEVTSASLAPTLTVTRGMEGTTGFAFPNGSLVSLRTTKDSHDRKQDQIANSSDVIDFGAAASLEIPNSAAPAITVSGQVALDTSVTDYADGVVCYQAGATVYGIVAVPLSGLASPTDSYVVTYDAATDKFKLAAGSIIFPTGRLTLVTATPVMTTDQAAKTTLYYTPYKGNTIPLYNGTDFINTEYTELSVATTDTTKNPTAIGVSKVNDWFIWDDAGTIRLSHGPDWTNDTTRSAGTALTKVNGVYLNNVTITNGPAASRGTYIGTTRSNSSSQLDYILGGAAANGSPASLFVWNMYNRIQVRGAITDSGGSHNWTTASWQGWNNATGLRLTYVCGFAEDSVHGNISAMVDCNGANITLSLGIGVDSTSTPSGITPYIYLGITTGIRNLTGVGLYGGVPGLGVHFIQGLEYGGANAIQWGTAAPSVSGLYYECHC